MRVTLMMMDLHDVWIFSTSHLHFDILFLSRLTFDLFVFHTPFTGSFYILGTLSRRRSAGVWIELKEKGKAFASFVECVFS